MPYADRTPQNRSTSLALVAIVHVGLGYALLTGLAGTFIPGDEPPAMTTRNIPIPAPPPPLPPAPIEDVREPQPQPRPAPPFDASSSPIDTTSANPMPPQIPLPPLPPSYPPTAGNGTAATPSPPAEPALVRSAAARGDPAAWISTNDYPARALREEREGTSHIRWDISAAGRVENCAVVSSSGSPDLDRAACAAITRRGRYQPALDATGAPTRATASRRVVWRLPAD